MKKPVIIAAIGVAIAAGGFAVSQAGDRGDRMFNRIDVNGDGQITRGEMNTHRAQRFARADADGDGRVTLVEMQDAGRKRSAERVAKMFEKMDVNGDGALVPGEIGEGADDRFQRMDANGDGVVTRDEIKAGRKKR